MSLAALAWRYLWARPLAAALNLALLALGLGAITFVLLVSEQVERAVQRDLAGIDLVVGAKGSPLQLILSGVFHLDVPTGNIPLAAVQTLRAHPLVERVIPLALGDSVQGFRIVGTTPDYLALYGATLARGRAWDASMQAVLGADVAAATGLAPGATFAGQHGLGRDGHPHGDTPYTVAGVLARCGCVLDRLVLTALESVWQVHEDDTATDETDRAVLEAEREVTLLLVGYRSPLAAATLPRWVNAQAGLQAAAPAIESARLLRLVGAGTEVLRGFGALMVLVAALSVFVALTHAVREREGDLAMLRMLGAPPARVAALVAAEASWLAALGVAGGLTLGHGLTHLLGWYLAAERSLAVTGVWFSAAEAVLVIAAFALAWIAAAWPARRAATLDVTTLLQAAR
ncbi:ABC transporter permease [Calidifontimicrobium sp. SYSU G02091]|uniref:ABC transporter permease n=1 Tax=Calidifontimicrobium sp. SYSU G02091 TaxID=2926421 RepID=UPI001F53A0E7|nr:FtsX-like permease family protein [Calidifontimicrobium sp. SYSU G02091]MCI1191798.1 ABC transporter permease [Calidifontimicrobium sp. SYSU G02091]